MSGPGLCDSRGRLRLSAGRPVVRAVFTGDLCPIGRVEQALALGDIGRAFGNTLELFAAADFAVVNLEAPLCRAHSPIAKCGPNFRADTRAARALAAAGVDVCCLANNHIMDQGPVGLRETLAALDASGLRHVGAGPDQMVAGGPLLLESKGVRLALLNFAIVEGAIAADGPGAARLDVLTVRRAVARTAAGGARVIPVLHAGREEVLFPSPGLVSLCRELVDAGASAVVCHHPHVPQGIEVYQGRPIAYSLGNFLFDWHKPEPHTDSSFLLELGLSHSGVVELAVHPFRKSAGGGAELLDGRGRASWLRFFRDISRPLGDGRMHERLWVEQCRPQLDAAYVRRLERVANVNTPHAAVRRKAEVTVLNLLEDLEHGEVLKAALRARVTGRDRPDRAARQTLDRLARRLRAFGAGAKIGS
ncbi:MAG: hypothetical protein AMXMBFR7_51920 [Planctomycetota bacterium]